MRSKSLPSRDEIEVAGSSLEGQPHNLVRSQHVRVAHTVIVEEVVRRRYQSFPETPAIEPLLIPDVNWSRLKNVEATIY